VKHYQIRFNTKAEPGDPLVWRVIDSGVERLASDVYIAVPSWSEMSKADGQDKWNIACDGSAMWQGDRVIIR
jgi:hypothetical protein